MICSLPDFPLAPPGQIPLCEIEGKLQYSTPELLSLHVYTPSVSSHPNVTISADLGHHHSFSKPFGTKVFLPTSEDLLQQLQQAWYEGGLKRVVEVLADPQLGAHWIVNAVAQKYSAMYSFIEQFAQLILPHSLKLQDVEVKELRNPGPVRCMSWHPHITKLGVATSDDAVTIYSTQTHYTPILKAKSQKNVTCIAWRPLSSIELAVGCAEGVYIWAVDPNSVISKPSVSCATLLKRKNVVSLAWSPEGDILVTAHKGEGLLTVWEVDSQRNVHLGRVSYRQMCLLEWSPNGSRLLSASDSDQFRIWNCETWESEVWWTAGGRISAAAWSPNGSILVFATEFHPYLYILQTGAATSIFASTTQKKPTAQMVADVSKVQVDETEAIIGGEVVGLTWDKRGKHLAVAFKDSPVVAVFITTLSPHFILSPGFFISGLEVDEVPTAIQFEGDFKEGANLTICWSTGRVQYFPIIYRQSENASQHFVVNCSSAANFDRSSLFKSC